MECGQVVHVANCAVELDVRGEVQRRAEGELVARTASFMAGCVESRVVMHLNFQIGIGRLQPPPVRDLPGRRQLDSISFSSQAIADLESDRGELARADLHELDRINTAQVVIMIVEKRYIGGNTFLKLMPIPNFISD